MIIKIDLEKAYDHIMWNFIIETLRGVFLPSLMMETIMQLTVASSVSYVMAKSHI